MIIIGGGMAGLLAGTLDRTAKILEAQPRIPRNHAAVLRFRTDTIGRALNIEFRRVKVLKAIWENEREVPLTPARVNRYSQKCVGAVVARSLSTLNTEPVERFIAPKDFIPQMAALVGERLELGSVVTAKTLAELPRPLISTIPLPRLLELLSWPVEERPEEFAQVARVTVQRYFVPNADVFQTVYFPHPDQPVYRASITGDELLIESVGTGALRTTEFLDVLQAFGLRPQDTVMLDSLTQPLGKIVELPPAPRKALLGRITREHAIWSLGRYATWRNVLLDDVLEDFYAIREMMQLSPYDQLRMSARA